ncbi:hypothetical protein [Aeromonas rivipollensis]
MRIYLEQVADLVIHQPEPGQVLMRVCPKQSAEHQLNQGKC